MSNDSTVEEPKPKHSPSRLAGYLCPPVGLWLQWRTPGVALSSKIFITIGLLTNLILHMVAGVFVLTATGYAELDRLYPPRLAWIPAGITEASWPMSGQPVKTNQRAAWPGFRGVDRTGVYTGPAIRTDWAKSPPKLLWKTTHVGQSHASMAIAQGRLFTLDQWEDGEAVTAFNLEDGKGLWKHVTPGVRFKDNWGGGAGPRSTPTWDAGRVYVMGTEGLLQCLDAVTGKQVWAKDILEENETRNLLFGMCASPLVVGDKLIVTAGAKARGRSTVIAYHKVTGKVIWESKLEKQAYMSPMLVTLAGREQLLITGGRELMGVAVKDGEQLWSHPWRVSHDNNIAQPVVIGDNQVFLSAGYHKGCALVQIDKTGDDFRVRELWQNDRLKNKFTSSVLHDGCLYGLDDVSNTETALVCLEAATGKEQWRGNDYGHGQLLLANDHLIILAANGELALVKASPSAFKEIVRIPALPGKTWNHPALAEGRLYIRNGTQMACYDIRMGSAAGNVPVLASITSGDSPQVLGAALGLTLGLGGMVLLIRHFTLRRED